MENDSHPDVVVDDFGARYLLLTEAESRCVKMLRAARERAEALGVELWVEREARHG
jgi:nucleotide-binding universal stress UspA family protein